MFFLFSIFLNLSKTYSISIPKSSNHKLFKKQYKGSKICKENKPNYYDCVEDEVAQIIEGLLFADITDVLLDKDRCVTKELCPLLLDVIKECDGFVDEVIEMDLKFISSIIIKANQKTKKEIQPLLDKYNEKANLISRDIANDVIITYKTFYNEKVELMIQEINKIFDDLSESIATEIAINSKPITDTITFQNNDLIVQVINLIESGVTDVDIIMDSLVYTNIEDIYTILDLEKLRLLNKPAEVRTLVVEVVMKYGEMLKIGFDLIKSSSEESFRPKLDELKALAFVNVNKIIRENYGNINEAIVVYLTSTLDEKLKFIFSVINKLKAMILCIIENC